MTMTNTSSGQTSSSREPIDACLERVEELIRTVAQPVSDAGLLEQLGEALRSLHARLRIHHATDFHVAGEVEALAPQLGEDRKRLSAEHQTILGMLDRCIRCGESIADQPIEEQAVFFLRIQEVIAVIRRHEAEEDRLLYLAVWRDTGGES